MEKEMVKLIQSVPALLDKLAQSLGVAAGKIWEWAMLEVYVNMTLLIVTIIVAIILDTILYKIFKWAYKEGFDLMKEAYTGIPIVIVTVVAFVFTIIGFLNIFDLPGYIINPEYRALQLIIEQMSALK